MSWSLSIQPTPKEEFDAAVDAAQPGGQDASLPGVAEDVAAAKDALKAFGKRVKRAKVSGSANGHALQEGEGDNWSDSVSANVWGSN
jgi:hypothetical protein